MSVAKVWSRPLARTGIVVAALVACGLLVSACSEAPKSKAPAPQPTSSEEKASPPPVREVQEPPAPPADFKDQVGEPGPAPSSPENDKALEAPDKSAEPRAGMAAPEMPGAGVGAGGSSSQGAEPPAAEQSARPSMAEPEIPAGGAAPPSDMSPPPPPPSLGEGAPPPSAESAPSAEAPSSPPAPPVAGENAQPPARASPSPVTESPPAAEAPSEAPPAAAEAPPAPTEGAPTARSAEPEAMPSSPPMPSAPAPAADAPSGPPPAAAEAPAAPESVPAPAAPKAKAAMRAAPESDASKAYDVVPVFYGTDRQIEPDLKRLQFGSERGHKLQLGRALITVPLIHKVPHIERPVVIEIPYFKFKIYEEKEDPKKHFTVQEISSLTEEQMLALVQERLKTSSTFKDHAFVFVHGFNTSFDCALFRTAQIAYDLHFDGVPFVYSWPSGGKVASYTYDHGSVEQAEQTLSEFLDLVVQKSGAKSISLIAHSMGNELLLRVLERQKLKVPKGVVISQVILAAPDVDRDKFNNIAREITSFAKGVTLYAASNDRALGYSARFWGGVPRAGDVPAKGGPLIIPGVDTIDVTAVSTDALGLNHSGYAENPTLLNDVKALVEFGLRPPDKRIKNVLTVQTDAGTFWRFQAGQ